MYIWTDGVYSLIIVAFIQMNWWLKLAIQFNLWFKPWYTWKRYQFVICFGPTKSSSSTIGNCYFLLLFQPDRHNKLIVELSVHFGIQCWCTKLALSCFIHVFVRGKLFYDWTVSQSGSLLSLSLSLSLFLSALHIFSVVHGMEKCTHLNSEIQW